MIKPYIIHITGIQGSGKSYICSKLKNIPCIDTDKILYDTFTQLQKNKKFKSYITIPDKNSADNIPEKASNLLFKQAKKDLIDKIKKINSPVVVVVGITIDVKSDLKLFIKLNGSELERVYRKVMMREADKIKNNYNSINQIINTENIYDISYLLLFKYEIGAINQVMPFAGYKKLYQSIEKMENKQGALIKTQSHIIEYIEKIHKLKTSIKIRKIKKSDIGKAKKLIDLYQIEHNKTPRKISDNDFWKIAKNSFVDDDMRSIATLENDLLRLIIVDPRYRGMGYGRALMNHINNMITWLVIDKPMKSDLISYYKRFGFNVSENTDKHIIMKR